MKRIIIVLAALLVCLSCVTKNAQSSNPESSTSNTNVNVNANTAATYILNNKDKEYVLTSLTEGKIETDRTHRMILCDYQPSGLYVKEGERIGLNVKELSAGYDLSAMIGFKPMWGNHNETQEVALKNGANTVTASQEGILSFIFVKHEGYDTAPTTVKIKVTGGRAFPLYQLNKTDAATWQNDLKTMTDAPFVQLVSDKVLITLPYEAYEENPIPDVPASFKTIHQVVDWEDEVAGFDGSSPENVRTRNRLHYLVDLYATPKERENFYMYASNYMIGMKDDNFTELTEKLNVEWGIWHETGHTQQQDLWTWDSISEVSVNIFSLYVQEKFGQPSRLGTMEEGESETTFARARAYVAQPKKNYLASNEADYNELFTKLVMFHQLRTAYGWDSIKKLHQYFRKQPASDGDESDEEKAGKFVYAMCVVTKNDLRPFFKKWGIAIDSEISGKIDSLKLPLPSVDPATVFQ